MQRTKVYRAHKGDCQSVSQEMVLCTKDVKVRTEKHFSASQSLIRMYLNEILDRSLNPTLSEVKEQTSTSDSKRCIKYENPACIAVRPKLSFQMSSGLTWAKPWNY